MQVVNQEKWDSYVRNNQDGYGKGIIDYAERWANLMEIEIEKGQKLVDIANRTSHEADTEGITGFMYGAAVQTLTNVWQYGNELRMWHNGEYGVTEDQANGGVVNPAIVNVNLPSVNDILGDI